MGITGHETILITYDEKSALLAKGNLGREIQRGLSTEKYRDRNAEVRVTRGRDHLEIVIEDAGLGFEVGSYLTREESRLFDRYGRGILLAKAALEIHHIEPRNVKSCLR